MDLDDGDGRSIVWSLHGRAQKVNAAVRLNLCKSDMIARGVSVRTREFIKRNHLQGLFGSFDRWWIRADQPKSSKSKDFFSSLSKTINLLHVCMFVCVFVCSWYSWTARWRGWVAWYTDVKANWCEWDFTLPKSKSVSSHAADAKTTVDTYYLY